METDDLKELFNTVLDERDALDAHTHRQHHDYIDTLIIETETKRDRKEAIIRQVCGWGVISLLIAIGTAVYNFFIRGHGTP